MSRYFTYAPGNKITAKLVTEPPEAITGGNVYVVDGEDLSVTKPLMNVASEVDLTSDVTQLERGSITAEALRASSNVSKWSFTLYVYVNGKLVAADSETDDDRYSAAAVRFRRES
ncbi:hypothetical protein [Haliangium sp.]|uniref:hypothetical protein n=1 Tax=Haliangium sp. TaxID=2663208 RepID=UPI003D10421E